MSVSLREYQIGGLANNLEFLQRCVDHPAFQKGGVTTGFLVEHEADVSIPPPSAPTPHLLALAAFALLQHREGGPLTPSQDSVGYVRPLLISPGLFDRMGHAGAGRQRAAGSVWTKGAWRAFGERTVPLPFSGDGIAPKAKGAAGGAVTATVHRDGSYSVAVGGTKDSMKVHGNVDAAGDGGKAPRTEAVSISMCMLAEMPVALWQRRPSMA